MIAFFLFGLVWPLLIDLVFSQVFTTQSPNWIQQYRAQREFLTSLSPMVGPMSAIKMFQSFEFEQRGPIWNGIAIAILTKAIVAGIVLWLTIKTFDRCLGRVPESRFPARRQEIRDPGGTGAKRNFFEEWSLARDAQELIPTRSR